MPANYVLLEKITVGAAGASSVTFSGIPQTGYTDLVLKGSTRTTRAAVTDYCYIYPNGSADMSAMRIGADGSSAGSSGGTTSAYTTFAIPGANSTANTFGNFEIYFTNYNSTTTYKSFSEDIVAENNATLAESGFNAILYKSNTAISSIEIYPSVGPFAQYSTFYLYGVAKLGTTPAISPYATGGDTIMTDGTYWYHTFVSSGTFTPQKGLTCDYLVVAGGASGGSAKGGTPSGAGGAGGLRSTVTATGGGGSLESALSLASGTGYTVTIGAGGAQAPAMTENGLPGSNSVFSTITSTGGGYGAKDGATGGTGGSGGGGSYTGGSGTGTANQGYAGGAGSTGANQGSGGGGGAASVGAGGTTTTGGNGGAGVATSITGSSVTYAGGGGGGTYNGGTPGTGGSGGGGAGALNASATNGTANLGGGGGGAGGTNGVQYYGGKGGSGIVIVRYAV